jgi:hypothetical protein
MGEQQEIHGESCSENLWNNQQPSYMTTNLIYVRQLDFRDVLLTLLLHNYPIFSHELCYICSQTGVGGWNET